MMVFLDHFKSAFAKLQWLLVRINNLKVMSRWKQLNTEVQKHWAWIVLGWELQVLLRLWESLDCVHDCLLVTAQRGTGHLNVARPRGAMKMA